MFNIPFYDTDAAPIPGFLSRRIPHIFGNRNLYEGMAMNWIDGKNLPSLAGSNFWIQELPCCQPEHDTTIRTHNILFILARFTGIPQVSAASNGFHQRIEHHRLRADSSLLLVHWTAIGAGILITNLLTVAAHAFWPIASQTPFNLNFELIFFIQPFIHIEILSHLMIFPPFLSTFRFD